MALLEHGEVARFLVGDAVDPTAKEDAGPFEGQGGRPIGINRRSTEKSGPFSLVCRGEGGDEESARNGPHPPRYARRPLPASLGEVAEKLSRKASVVKMPSPQTSCV